MSAAADPVWTKSPMGLMNGDVSTRRVNTALQAAGDHKAYPLLVTVGVPLTDTDRATYPVSGEADRLAEVTQALNGLIAGHGVLAASIADSSGWAFLIYTGSTQWLENFESQMRSDLADHVVLFRARRDPGWRAYRDLWRLAPRTLRARERIVLVTVVPVICAVPAARYGLAWAVASFVSIEAWAAVIAFVPRSRLISAQLARPGIAFGAAAGVMWTVLFPLSVIVVHPTRPWVGVALAAVVAGVIMLALWPSQRRFLDQMREGGALQSQATPAA